MMRLGLFAAGILSLMSISSAWAFSQQIVSPDNGNYQFTDPDQKITPNTQSGQGAQPFGSNGPTLQFGVQQGPLSSFGHDNRDDRMPDPYFGALKGN